MASVTFSDAERARWYASLPAMHGAAAALITDRLGRVLLVKPNYRDYWTLPGGILEHGEPPHEGCAREVKEEIGLAITPGPLLVLAWARPDGERPRPFVFFVFDGGEIAPGTGIRLQAEELEDHRFAGPADLASCLPPLIEARVRAGLAARAAGAAVYLPDGVPYPAA
jgi:ADP-ribose pyrophosphatase YjhB (NUDIX family)